MSKHTKPRPRAGRRAVAWANGKPIAELSKIIAQHPDMHGRAVTIMFSSLPEEDLLCNVMKTTANLRFDAAVISMKRRIEGR